MTRDMKAIAAGVLRDIKKTDLPPLPGDDSEPFDRTMRHVIEYQAGEIVRLEYIVKEAIRSMDGFEEAEDAQELHEILEEAQGVLYTSGLAAAEAAKGE